MAPSLSLDFVDSSLRRRLSTLAKASLQVAYECAKNLANVRIVYASRHGELMRTTSMLIDLANRQELSPMAFSMSVLNASAGVYSITRHDRSPSTAISAAESTLGLGLLEASLQLASSPTVPVLLIYADEPAPTAYGKVTGDVQCPLALGLLLDSDAATELVCEIGDSESISSPIAQPEAFLECLSADQTITWHGEGKAWTWTRRSK